jgi:hypothetical protein
MRLHLEETMIQMTHNVRTWSRVMRVNIAGFHAYADRPKHSYAPGWVGRFAPMTTVKAHELC